MPQLNFDEDSHSTARNREEIGRSLHEISVQVTEAVSGAGLCIPILLSVPSSGNALVTLVTPDDPSDDDWQRASEIVRDIVKRLIGVAGLRVQDIPCIAVNATMSPNRLA